VGPTVKGAGVGLVVPPQVPQVSGHFSVTLGNFLHLQATFFLTQRQFFFNFFPFFGFVVANFPFESTHVSSAFAPKQSRDVHKTAMSNVLTLNVRILLVFWIVITA